MLLWDYGVLCGYYGDIRVIGWYYVVLRGYYVGIMGVLCGYYVDIMWVLCGFYEI